MCGRCAAHHKTAFLKIDFKCNKSSTYYVCKKIALKILHNYVKRVINEYLLSREKEITRNYLCLVKIAKLPEHDYTTLERHEHDLIDNFVLTYFETVQEVIRKIMECYDRIIEEKSRK